MLVVAFVVFSLVICDFDFSFLFPVFPHVFFEKTKEVFSLFDAFLPLKYVILFLYYGFLSLYYIFLILSWYFIIKSLQKFTYKK